MSVLITDGRSMSEWIGHVLRMDGSLLPRIIFYSQLQHAGVNAVDSTSATRTC